MHNRGKVAIIGAGHVGSHCAMALAFLGACGEIVLVDKDRQKAEAQAMDVADALSFPPSSVNVRAGIYSDCRDADIVVIAIGEPRQPGQTRLDLLGNSVKMLHGLIADLKPVGISGIVITITNPADIVADYVRRGLGFDRKRVFGTGTLLDTARLIRTLSEKTGLSRASVSAVCMGEHGDSSVIPFSQVRIGGRRFESFENLDREEILKRTRAIGMEIICGKNSTEFGIGQALSVLCRCILNDEKQVLPLSVLLEGEYSQRGVHCGVPCVVGRDGIESILELPLTEQELSDLAFSCDVIRKHIDLAQQTAPIG